MRTRVPPHVRQGGLNFCLTVGDIFDLHIASVLRTSKRKTLLLPPSGFSRALEEKNMDFSISDLLGSSSPQNHAVQDRAVLSSTGDRHSSHMAPQSTGSLPTSPFMCWISQGMNIFSVSATSDLNGKPHRVKCWHTLPNDHPMYHVSHSRWLLGPCWHIYIMPNDPFFQGQSQHWHTLPSDRPIYLISYSM